MLAALWVSVTVSFVVSVSLPAFTVTVCARFQFAVVKVRMLEDGVEEVNEKDVRVTSVPPCPATVTVTFAVGRVSRTTV